MTRSNRKQNKIDRRKKEKKRIRNMLKIEFERKKIRNEMEEDYQNMEVMDSESEQEEDYKDINVIRSDAEKETIRTKLKVHQEYMSHGGDAEGIFLSGAKYFGNKKRTCRADGLFLGIEIICDNMCNIITDEGLFEIHAFNDCCGRSFIEYPSNFDESIQKCLKEPIIAMSVLSLSPGDGFGSRCNNYHHGEKEKETLLFILEVAKEEIRFIVRSFHNGYYPVDISITRKFHNVGQCIKAAIKACK